MKKLIALSLVTIALISSASADQPNMQNALANLRAAKSSLEAAKNNKGSWRVAAIAAVNKAIVETENGIRFAK